MIVLATCAFICGLLAHLLLPVVPFIAANLALLAGVGVWGGLKGLSAGSIALHAFVALASAQAGYASRAAIEIIRCPSGGRGSDAADVSGPRVDKAP